LLNSLLITGSTSCQYLPNLSKICKVKYVKYMSTVVTPADAQKVIRHSGIVYNNSELSFTLMKFGLPPNAGSQPPDVEPKSPNAGRKSPVAGRKSPNARNQTPIGGSQISSDGCKSLYAGNQSPNAGSPPPSARCQSPDGESQPLYASRKSPNADGKSPYAGSKSPVAGSLPSSDECKSSAIGPQPSVAGRKPVITKMSAEPKKSAESKKDEEPEGELLSARNTIVVHGVTNDVARDLRMFFENTGRSGGGPVSACVIDTSLGQALVTFSDAAGEL
jgi:hypothetical protein